MNEARASGFLEARDGGRGYRPIIAQSSQRAASFSTFETLMGRAGQELREPPL
jgi:hypothetical protein